jgi:regulatory protein
MDAAESQKFYEKVCEYILISPKTERQIRNYLFRKKIYKTDAEQIIQRLKENNFIDDANYAKLYTECKKEKLGINMIKTKLLQNGISGDILETVLDTVGEQNELCMNAVVKYMRKKEKDAKIKMKLFQYLLSRGYLYETAGEVINEYWNRY